MMANGFDSANMSLLDNGIMVAMKTGYMVAGDYCFLKSVEAGKIKV